MVYTALRLKQVGSIKFINMHKHLRIVNNLTILSNTFLLFQIKVTPKRCYCEHENGGPGKNGIMCGRRGTFKRNSECGTKEWCTGPTNEKNSVLGSSQLCKKGDRQLYDLYYFSTIFYFNIYIQISKTDRSTSSYILAIVNCGSDRMVPECSYCLVNNDTTIHAWCAGNCKYDRIEGTCTEIKGNIKTVIFRFTVMCLKSSGLTIRISEIVFR